MKKAIMMLMLAGFMAPAVMAGEGCDGDCPMKKMGKHDRAEWAAKNPEMKAKMDARRAEKKARKEQWRKNEEKVEKLVKEYKKASGKKQEAKKAEIAAVISSVRNEQLQMKQQMLMQFKDRLGKMEAKLQQEQMPSAKQDWVNSTTQAVIDNGGDLEDALEMDRRMMQPAPMMGAPMMPGPMMHGPAPEMMD